MLSGLLAIIDDNEDKQRFEELYYKYRQLMYSVAMNILHNEQSAEEAVQEAFINIAKNFSKVKEINCNQTKGYVVIIVRNVCFNILRKNRLICEWDTDAHDVEDSGISVEDDTVSKCGVELLERALKMLPQKYYDILYFTAFEEYSLKDAAKLLGITYANAKTRQKRARERLSQILEELGYERP